MTAQYRPRGRTASEIAADVEAAFRAGVLHAGVALPPIRALATHSDVSPGTVAAAYATLRTRGVVVTNGRRGTRIGRRPPIATTLTPTRPTGQPVLESVRDLWYGNPDPKLLPDLGPALARQVRKPRRYGEAAVEPALAETGAAWLAADGIDTTAMTVVSGAMDGVERVLTAWLAPGDRVMVEDPGYAAVLDLASALGLVTVPIPVDDDGPEPAAFARALRSGPAAVIVTPRAQNPTGAALSSARARELRRALDAHPDVLVIEDDHAGPVAGAPATTLVGDGRRGRWAVVRSVAKSLGPDLRCALIAGDAATVARVEGRLALGPGWVSGLLQGTVADLLSRAGTASLLDRAARTYERRRTALLRALSARSVHGGRGASGLNVWVPVADEAAVMARLLAGGIAVAGGSRFRIASPPAIRITTASLDVADAPAVADAVAAAVGTSALRAG